MSDKPPFKDHPLIVLLTLAVSAVAAWAAFSGAYWANCRPGFLMCMKPQDTGSIPNQTSPPATPTNQPVSPNPGSPPLKPITIAPNSSTTASTSSECAKENFQSTAADYSTLCNFLRDQNWDQADSETHSLLLKLANVPSEREPKILNPEEIKQLSCTDLRTIDKLWRTYSQNTFGFSVQARQWRRYGCSSYAWTCVNTVLLELGWRSRISGSGENSYYTAQIIEQVKQNRRKIGMLPRIADQWLVKDQFQYLWQRVDTCSEPN